MYVRKDSSVFVPVVAAKLICRFLRDWAVRVSLLTSLTCGTLSLLPPCHRLQWLAKQDFRRDAGPQVPKQGSHLV